jgi:hypothetical protein
MKKSDKKYFTNIYSEAYTYAGSTYSYTPMVREQLTEKEFDNYDDAVTAAKKTAMKTKEDVAIYTIDSIVKFPLADLEVEKVV